MEKEGLTPKQIAESLNHSKMQEWLLVPTRPPRESVDVIRYSHAESHQAHLARTVLDVRVSEIAVDCSLRLEKLTRVLNWLTGILVFLTVALVILTIALLRHP